jgi:transcriptional/translational regulatory protein YebC/TACO1
LGETGGVSFQFERVGLIRFDASKGFDTVFESAVNAGADNVDEAGDSLEITCPMDAFASVRDAVIDTLGDPLEAKIMWRPLNTISCDEETARTLIKMIDTLEDNDDVQNVYANFDVSEELAQKLAS